MERRADCLSARVRLYWNLPERDGQGSPWRTKKGKRMAARKTPQSGAAAHKSARQRQPDSALRQFSAIIGAALVGVAVLWFVWLLVRPLSPGLVSITFPVPGILPQNPPNAPKDPLIAAGITLSSPAQSQQPLLTRQQAIFLVNQMEPQVAAHAGGVNAQYTLFSYHGGSSSASGFQNVPVWLVHYTSVAEPRPDTAADPRASSTQHDLYVFLDANNGRELLALWL